ncbi:MAG: chromate transporter [Peptoanaerobacter stomatis]|uniref:chromate transporter n=1 Tax=Peptoanaerobacter stomatis TaxID=796937 RepID=UPI003FA0C57D
MIKLFLIFFKIGAVTFGGGYAMIPIIEKELVEKNKLITDDEFIDFVSVAQSFPGPIAVNISLLIGHRLNGFWGSVFSLIGVIMPSFLSILAVGFFYVTFKNSKIVRGFFNGVSAVVPALLAISFISILKKIDKNYIYYSLILISFLLVFILNVNPLWTIALGGGVGICTHLFQRT